eukprot:4493431-Amphidinium_carterae.1
MSTMSLLHLGTLVAQSSWTSFSGQCVKLLSRLTDNTSSDILDLGHRPSHHTLFLTKAGVMTSSSIL